MADPLSKAHVEAFAAGDFREVGRASFRLSGGSGLIPDPSDRIGRSKAVQSLATELLAARTRIQELEGLVEDLEHKLMAAMMGDNL